MRVLRSAPRGFDTAFAAVSRSPSEPERFMVTWRNPLGALRIAGTQNIAVALRVNPRDPKHTRARLGLTRPQSDFIACQSMMSRRVFGLSFLFTERLCTYTSNLGLFPAFTETVP
jgi:hypothetical protein